MEGTTLVVIEHDRGTLADASLEALAAARGLGTRVEAVTVGADAATGAGAVVTKDVPPYGRAVGVPARLLPPKSEPAP